jgi:hypothetical protein
MSETWQVSKISNIHYNVAHVTHCSFVECVKNCVLTLQYFAVSPATQPAACNLQPAAYNLGVSNQRLPAKRTTLPSRTACAETPLNVYRTTSTTSPHATTCISTQPRWPDDLHLQSGLSIPPGYSHRAGYVSLKN